MDSLMNMINDTEYMKIDNLNQDILYNLCKDRLDNPNKYIHKSMKEVNTLKIRAKKQFLKLASKIGS